MKRLIVIGGGPGGVAAATRAAQLGAQVSLIEAAHLGGVCMNRGCVPLRILGKAAEHAAQMTNAGRFGVSVKSPKLDKAALKGFLDETLEYMRPSAQGLLKTNGVEIIQGKARLTAAGQVRVQERLLDADAVILATGGRWNKPEIPGADLEGVITSDDLFDGLDLPKSLIVLGGRPWSVELASFYRRFGSKVTLVVPDRFLPEIDRQVTNRLRASIKKQGIVLIRRAEPLVIEKKGSGLQVKVKVKGQETTLTAARVLMTDRIPHLKGLGLEDARVTTEKGVVKVDRRLRTSNPKVFVVGDLTGEPLLSHKASAQGVAAAESALGAGKHFDLTHIPTALYTFPEVAAVGLTENEAKARGHEVVVGEVPYVSNTRAMAELAVEGFVKIVCGAKYHEVLGVHIIGPHSAELITQAVLALKLEATADDLADLIAPHPTFAESLADAARMVLGNPLSIPKQNN